MLGRFGAVCLSLVLLAVSAATLEGAGASAHAQALVKAARDIQDPSARASYLAAAERELDQSWAAPARWHGGAAQARAAIAALAATSNRTNAAGAAFASVRLSPVQPAAWLQLAAARQAGSRTRACDLAQCLQRSWIAAPLYEEELTCQRLRLAYEGGYLQSNDDPKLTWYLASGVASFTAQQCLSFLPSRRYFALFLERTAR